MKIILLDVRNRFRDDIRNRLLIDDERNVELLTDLENSHDLATAISRFSPELIVVADNVFPERSSWSNLGVPVVAYCTKPGAEDIFTPLCIPHYPVIASASHLLNLLEGGVPQLQQPSTQQSATENQQTFNVPYIPQAPQAPNYQPDTTTPQAPQALQGAVAQPHGYIEDLPYPAQQPVLTPSQPKPQQFVQPAHQTAPTRPTGLSFNAPVDDDDLYTPMGKTQVEAPSPMGRLQAAPIPQPMEQNKPPFMPAAHNATSGVNPYPYQTSQIPQQPSTIAVQPPVTPTTSDFYGGVNAKAQLDQDRAQRNANLYESTVMQDISSRNTKTKTVAVYSAKGGVGKTTIATELATILSMTSSGRGNYRVCLIDYNVDFGDVLTTLNLNNRGPNLTHWTNDVRRKMQAGTPADQIVYSRAEIEGRLQRVGNSSLYALVAPVTHEDSMDIRSEEPGVILRNIIANGAFDFVVCDTGNNTRDATVSALDAADIIFMIVTQDVSAVNCDKAFLQTMNRVGFDVDKIRIVMNGIMPYKFTQVSVQEVEEMFPYPCIARFKRDPEVTKANNCSEPIVKKPNHEFTQEMRKLVAYVTGNSNTVKPKKAGLFGWLKKG